MARGTDPDTKRKALEMTEKGYPGEFLAGFIVGGLVGAAVALLFAPQSGEETRTLIREKGVELGERADQVNAEARRKAEEIQLQAKDKAGEFQGKMKQAVEDGKAAAAKKREDLLSQLEPEQGGEEIVI